MESGEGCHMTIIPGKETDAEKIAFIVSEANKDVAKLFGLTIQNTPKHPSFYTPDWVLSDFKRGEQYFLYSDDETSKGCVAFEQPDAKTAYLNRLSVLPEYRHNKIGSTLVQHILEYADTKNILYVSIGIIAEHEMLKQWYLKLGFVKGDTRKFEHLPFDVLYMRYDL